MVWTSVSMPTYLAEQYDTTQYIVLEGPKSETLGHVTDNHVPPSHSSVYTHEHDSYGNALALAFEEPTYTEAVGVTEMVLNVNPEQLTVVLEEDL